MTRELRNNCIVIALGAVLFACVSVAVYMYDISQNTQFALFLIAYLLISVPMFQNIINQIGHRSWNGEDIVILAATIGTLAIGRYIEAIAVMLFFEIASTIERTALYHSKKNIESLIDIRPSFAIRKVQGREVQVLPGELEKNHIIVIKPGERIPVDCVVTSGESTLDTQAITGESMPQLVKVGNRVYSGSINLTGMLEARVVKIYEESTVSKIMNLVEQANNNKSEQQIITERFAKIYTPIIVLAALGLMFVPPIVYGRAWGVWLYRGLIFLIAACPSGLVLSVPIAFFGGIGASARNGIMVKGGNHLETLSKVETFIFDKTGTLTKGVFKVKEIKGATVTEEELLKIAAHVESYSNHPIALSLRESYPYFIDQEKARDVQEFSGYGVEATFEGKKVSVGNRKLMEKNNIAYPQDIETPGTAVFVAIEGLYVGHIIVGDELKDNVQEMIDYVKEKCHAVTVMLTGDSQSAGEMVADDLGIDFVYTRLLPEDKMEHMEEFMESQDDTERTAFVGDGINDAPVLAMADVGIAMGALGSDAAIEAADIVLMDDEPVRIMDAMGIARETMRVVHQNLIFALVIKLLVLVLAGMGYLSMWSAVVADIGVMILSIFNAAFIVRY